MKPFKALSIVALLCLLFAAFSPASAAAQDAGFTDTFDDPQLPGWEHSPEVAVSGGVLRVAPGNFCARLGAWQDLDVTLNLRYEGPGVTEVQYRASDGGAYALILDGERTLLVRNVPQGEGQELARAGALQAAGGEWLALHIVLAQGQHTISIGGAPLLTATDPDPLPPGGLLIASHGERTTEVDDVTLQGSAPAPALPGPEAQAAEAPAAGMPGAAPTATPAPVAPNWQRFLDTLGGQAAPLELDTFAVNLLLAVLTSYILSRVYVYWGSSLSNRRRFAANFTLITVTTAFIILIVRSSVALSLGLVGALSIIRFRAAIKEPEELAYLFFAISLGIGLGDNQRLVTLLTLLVVIAVIGLSRLLRHPQADTNLHVTVGGSAAEVGGLQPVMEVLAQHTSRLRLLRYDEAGGAVEMSFVAEFRDPADLNGARAALQALSPSVEISFLDNKGVW